MLAYRSAFSADGPVDQVAPAVRDVMVDWAEKKHRKKLGPDGLGALAPGVRLQPHPGLELLMTDTREELEDRVFGFVVVERHGTNSWASQVMVAGGPRLGLILSIATVYFRDLGHLWQIFNQIWMYASGVVFPLTMINGVQNRLFDAGWQINGAPIPIVTIARLNPAETYLEAFRSCLYDFALPSLPVSLACLGWAVVMLTVGLTFFRRRSASIVEEL